MRTLFLSVDFSEYKDLCTLNKIPWMIPSILRYAPPAVELLGATIYQFSKQIAAAILLYHTLYLFQLYPTIPYSTLP